MVDTLGKICQSCSVNATYFATLVEIQLDWQTLYRYLLQYRFRLYFITLYLLTVLVQFYLRFLNRDRVDLNREKP